MNKYLYTCLGCGFKVFKEVFSEYEICPICNYQDTNSGMLHPFVSSFSYDNSLSEYQEKILKKIPYKIKEYRNGNNIYIRNSLWKPININKIDKNHNYFPKWKLEEFHNKYPKSSDYHKKLMDEAQKYNPDEKSHMELNELTQ